MGDRSKAETLRLIDGDDARAWLADDAPTLIVAGAGLSMGPPTDAPGVSPFMHRTLDQLIRAAGFDVVEGKASVGPDGFEIHEVAKRLLPESCYGVIGQVFNTNRHLDMWAALGPEAANRVGSSPSPAHHTLVGLAATRGWPIITTNFDCFLEAAALQDGYACDPVIPHVSQHVELESELGRVTLMKLHGSTVDAHGSRLIRRVERIRSTAADLSRCARIMERLRFNPEPARLLVVGYSGRDLDLFPWLCSRFGGPNGSGGGRILWVDPDFRDAVGVGRHRARIVAESAVGLPAFANEIAETPPHSASLSDSAARRTRFQAEAERAVDEALAAVLTPETPETAAALAGVLSSVGMHLELVELESQLTAPGTYSYGRMCGLLWLAGAYSALDRYDEALRVSSDVRRRALRGRSVNAFLRAWLAGAYASTAGSNLTIVRSRKRSARRKMVGPYLSVFAATAAVAPSAAIYYFRTRNQDDPASDRYSLVSDYLEHWIRLGALLDKIRRPFPLANRPLNGLWSIIDRACRSAGYTTGVLHAGRYRGRVSGGLAWYDSSVTRAELVGHPIGLAIAHRDTALAELKSHRPIESVTEHLSLALEYAERAQSPSLILKVRYEQMKVGTGPAMTPDEIDALIDRTSGCRALSAQRAEVVRELSLVRGLTDHET